MAQWMVKGDIEPKVLAGRHNVVFARRRDSNASF